MRVLIALEDVGLSEHLFRTAEATFGHVKPLTFKVAYPEDAVTRRPEEYEAVIDDWRETITNEATITSAPLSGPTSYDELILELVREDKKIEHLVIGPQESPLAQRLFGNAPSPFFVKGPVPITVAYEPDDG